MIPHCKLSLPEGKAETPEVRKWLDECERILNARIDQANEDLLVYGSTVVGDRRFSVGLRQRSEEEWGVDSSLPHSSRERR